MVIVSYPSNCCSSWLVCVCRGFATSSSRNGQDSWFKSLFVRKVDPRKDTHANLLTKNEESNLYKIQCKFTSQYLYLKINHLSWSHDEIVLKYDSLFQSIMSNRSAWMRTTNSGECYFISLSMLHAICMLSSYLSKNSDSSSSIRPGQLSSLLSKNKKAFFFLSLFLWGDWHTGMTSVLHRPTLLIP